MSSTYFKLYVDWILAKNSCFLDLIWIHLKTSHKLQSQGAMNFWSHHLQILSCLLHRCGQSLITFDHFFYLPLFKAVGGEIWSEMLPILWPCYLLRINKKNIAKGTTDPSIGCLCLWNLLSLHWYSSNWNGYNSNKPMNILQECVVWFKFVCKIHPPTNNLILFQLEWHGYWVDRWAIF